MKFFYTLERPAPNIFYLRFDKKHKYSMGMLFLRCQEFYESINPDFRGKSFKILEFMDWYVGHYKQKAFQYPDDFVGYNIPSEVISVCLQSVPPGDFNAYDDEMLKLCSNLLKKTRGKKFYLIAGSDDGTFKHELAHGLWYTNNEYKLKMLDAISRVPMSIRKRAYAKLEKHYSQTVLDDEFQAYMATGLSESIGFSDKVKPYRRAFIKIFKNYANGVQRI